MPRVRTEIEAAEAIAAPRNAVDSNNRKSAVDLPVRLYVDWWLPVRDLLQRRPARLRDFRQNAENARDADPQSFRNFLQLVVLAPRAG